MNAYMYISLVLIWGNKQEESCYKVSLSTKVNNSANMCAKNTHIPSVYSIQEFHSNSRSAHTFINYYFFARLPALELRAKKFI